MSIVPTDLWHRAYLLMAERIGTRTSWGKNELRKLMLRCILEEGDKKEPSPELPEVLDSM